MTSLLSDVFRAILIGVGATVLTDLWNLGLKLGFRISSLDFCLLGRWLGHMPGGIFRHADIRAAPVRPFECALGGMAHYAIGSVLGGGFVLAVSRDWLARPTLFPALVYGVATVVFPLFLLQPALGFGFAAAKTSRPVAARVKSVATHTMFGLGLYWAAVGLAGL